MYALRNAHECAKKCSGRQPTKPLNTDHTRFSSVTPSPLAYVHPVRACSIIVDKVWGYTDGIRIR